MFVEEPDKQEIVFTESSEKVKAAAAAHTLNPQLTEDNNYVPAEIMKIWILWII